MFHVEHYVIRMATNYLVTLGNKGSKRERTVDARSITIPDLWHIAHAQPDAWSRALILDCWHLAHDLKDALVAELTKTNDKEANA